MLPRNFIARIVRTWRKMPRSDFPPRTVPVWSADEAIRSPIKGIAPSFTIINVEEKRGRLTADRNAPREHVLLRAEAWGKLFVGGRGRTLLPNENRKQQLCSINVLVLWRSNITWKRNNKKSGGVLHSSGVYEKMLRAKTWYLDSNFLQNQQ